MDRATEGVDVLVVLNEPRIWVKGVMGATGVSLYDCRCDDVTLGTVMAP